MLGTPRNLGLGLQEIWETKDTHVQKIPNEFANGLFVGISGSLLFNYKDPWCGERNHDSHESDVQRDLIHYIIWNSWTIVCESF